jgi:hypothetical protein
MLVLALSETSVSALLPQAVVSSMIMSSLCTLGAQSNVGELSGILLAFRCLSFLGSHEVGLGGSSGFEFGARLKHAAAVVQKRLTFSCLTIEMDRVEPGEIKKELCLRK